MSYNNFLCSKNKTFLTPIGEKLERGIIYYGNFNAYAVQLSTTDSPMDAEEITTAIGEPIPNDC